MILGVVLVVPILLVSYLLYNVYFHPLRHYPGPILAGATRAYYLLWDVRGLSHWKVKEWHEKYGDVIRIAPNELSYTNGQAWLDIYGFANKQGTGNFEKDAQWWNKTVNGVENILTADNEGHRRMRRLQNPAFSDKALKTQESVITKYNNLLVDQLHKHASNPISATIDMVAWANFATFDIIGELAFGEGFHCLQEAQWHWWIKAVFDIFKAGTYLRAARRFSRPFADLLMMMIPKELLATRVTQFQFSAERVQKRMQDTVERHDFMSHILNASNEKGMSDGEVMVAAQLLIVAGSETTATALSGAIYLLLSSPQTYKRLSSEIRDRFALEADITIQNTASLAYLDAVVSETLRLCPPGPGTFPRVVPAPGRVVCGRFVPGGCSVGVHQLSANRSSANFGDSESFFPERWMDDVRFKDDKKAACQPYSFGPRNCIGKK